jgi:hypothetical protein
MHWNDTQTLDRDILPEAFDEAGVALAIFDDAGALEVANSKWRAEGRERFAPMILQVVTGGSCTHSLHLRAQQGDESAERMLLSLNRIRSGLLRNARCEFYEAEPLPRCFDITMTRLMNGGGVVMSSMDVTARKFAAAAIH